MLEKGPRGRADGLSMSTSACKWKTIRCACGMACQRPSENNLCLRVLFSLFGDSWLHQSREVRTNGLLATYVREPKRHEEDVLHTRPFHRLRRTFPLFLRLYAIQSQVWLSYFIIALLRMTLAACYFSRLDANHAFTSYLLASLLPVMTKKYADMQTD